MEKTALEKEAAEARGKLNPKPNPHSDSNPNSNSKPLTGIEDEGEAREGRQRAEGSSIHAGRVDTDSYTDPHTDPHTDPYADPFI